MAEFEDACSALADIIADYREGDAIPRGQDHVSQWVGQFEAEDRIPILKELRHVLGRTYFSRAKIVEFLSGLFAARILVGDNPCAFWRAANFLDIQGGGHSQKEMLALFNVILGRRCGFGIADFLVNSAAFAVRLTTQLVEQGEGGGGMSVVTLFREIQPAVAPAPEAAA